MRGWKNTNIRKKVNDNRNNKLMEKKQKKLDFTKRMEKSKQINGQLYELFKEFIKNNSKTFNYPDIINHQLYDDIISILQANKNNINKIFKETGENIDKITITIRQLINVLYEEFEFNVTKNAIIKPFIKWYKEVYIKGMNKNNQITLTTTKYNNTLFIINKKLINKMNLDDVEEIINNNYPCGCPTTCKHCNNSYLNDKFRELNRCIICEPHKYIPCIGFTCNCLIKSKIKTRYDINRTSNPPLGVCENHIKIYAASNINQNLSKFKNEFNNTTLNCIQTFTRINIIHARSKNETSYYKKIPEIDVSIKNWFPDGCIYITGDKYSLKYWPYLNLINDCLNFKKKKLIIYKFTYQIENENNNDNDESDQEEYIVKQITKSKYNHEKKNREWEVEWNDKSKTWETHDNLMYNEKFNDFNTLNNLKKQEQEIYKETEDKEIVYNVYPCCMDIDEEQKSNNEITEAELNIMKFEKKFHVVTIINFNKLIIILDPNKLNDKEEKEFIEHFKSVFFNGIEEIDDIKIYWKGLNINDNYMKNITNIEDHVDGLCETLINYILHHIAENYKIINKNAFKLNKEDFLNYIINGINSICNCLRVGMTEKLFKYGI